MTSKRLALFQADAKGLEDLSADVPVKDVSLEENTLEFTLQLPSGSTTVSVIAGDDYPDNTVVMYEGVPHVLRGRVADAYAKAIQLNASTVEPPASPAHPLNESLPEMSDYEEDKIVVDEHLNIDLRNAKLELGDTNVTLIHPAGLDIADVTVNIQYKHLLSNITKQAWGLEAEGMLVVKVHDIHVQTFRHTTTPPTVSVYLESGANRALAVTKQLKMILTRYLRACWSLANERELQCSPSIFYSIHEYVQMRLCRLSETCIVCDEFHEFNGLIMPTICSNPLCTFAFEDLGLMSDVASMITPIEVIDLLLAMLDVAAHSNTWSTILSPFPAIADPDKVDKLAMDPANPNVAPIREVLSKMPKMEKLNSLLGEVKCLNDYHRLMWPLIRWSICTCRSFILPVPLEVRLNFMRTPHQFIMLTDSPAKEKAFRDAKTASGNSVFMFHGSPPSNWHGIVRQGLQNFSNTPRQLHGAAHGEGIYLSPMAFLSLHYSFACLGYDVRKVQLQANPTYNTERDKQLIEAQATYLGMSKRVGFITICEVVESEHFKATKHYDKYVLTNADHCCTRFLFAYDLNHIQVTDLPQQINLLRDVHITQQLRNAVDYYLKNA